MEGQSSPYEFGGPAHSGDERHRDHGLRPERPLGQEGQAERRNADLEELQTIFDRAAPKRYDRADVDQKDRLGMGVSLSYLSAPEGVNFVRSAGQGLGCIVHGLRCGEWPIRSRTARNYLEGWVDFASVLENHPNARHLG